jgi:hypothetical protein
MKFKGQNSPCGVMDEPTMTDLDPATERLCALIAELPEHDLDRSTRCTDYSVGDLVDHLASITDAFGGGDLSRGAGLPFEVDADGLAPLHDLVSQTFGPTADTAARQPAFQPAVPVPADASMLDQTLGMLGRHPAWAAA